MKQKFLEIYKKHITRPGSEELLAYLEKSDFFRAPASHKYHLSIPGGLVMHSVGVYNRLRELFLREKELKNDFTELTPEQEETIAICGLLHDLCKIDFYQQVKKSRKTGRLQPNGKPEWEDYYGYDIEEKLVYGHGEKSVYIASGFMRLTREEAIAIRFHMGPWQEGEARNAGNAFKQYPMAVLLHLADMMSTNLDEKEDSYEGIDGYGTVGDPGLQA